MSEPDKSTEYKEAIYWINLFASTSYRLVMGVHYFHYLSGQSGNMWSYFQNSVAHSSFLYWCHMFLDRDDDHYYKKFFGRPEIASIGPQFGVEAIKSRLLKAISCDNDKYVRFHKEMKIFRDTWVAHMELKDPSKSKVFPNLNACAEMGNELRRIILELCKEGASKNIDEGFSLWLLHFEKHSPDSLKSEAKALWENRERHIRR